jgi:release factor glutamine methyltransferase
VPTAKDLLQRAEKLLVDSPAIEHWQRGRERIEAEDLLEHVLGEEPDPEDSVPSRAARRFESLVDRRVTGEPIPYIKGYAEFRGMRLAARPGVFVPRDTSEFTAAEAIRRLRRRRAPVAVDLATGAGPVAIAIAKEVRGARVFGLDLAPEAVALARSNARRVGVSARFLLSDLFDALPRSLAGSVDVVTFHPPYVGRREVRELPDEVVKFEPMMALTDHSPKGLGLIERAVMEAGEWVRSGGWMLVEVDVSRSRSVATILRRGGFRDVRSRVGNLSFSRLVAGRL